MTELLSWLSKGHSARKKRLVQTDCFCFSVILSSFLRGRRQALDKERPCRRLSANLKIENGWDELLVYLPLPFQLFLLSSSPSATSIIQYGGMIASPSPPPKKNRPSLAACGKM